MFICEHRTIVVECVCAYIIWHIIGHFMDVIISIFHFISMNFIHKVVNTSPSVRCSSHSQTTSTAGKYNDSVLYICK